MLTKLLKPGIYEIIDLSYCIEDANLLNLVDNLLVKFFILLFNQFLCRVALAKKDFHFYDRGLHTFCFTCADRQR